MFLAILLSSLPASADSAQWYSCSASWKEWVPPGLIGGGYFEPKSGSSRICETNQSSAQTSCWSQLCLGPSGTKAECTASVSATHTTCVP